MAITIFTLSVFTGSFLLFLVQPMVGKILLPVMGGVPAVWTTCMLFFQMMLLAGYLYAEKTLRYLGSERQSILHVLFMTAGFIMLPLGIDTEVSKSLVGSPIVWLMIRLTTSIGFLFFILSANAPLLQRYYSQAGQSDSADPYFLYAASNCGSLLALLAYPLLIEPFFSLTFQRQLWSAIYVLQTFLMMACCFVFWQSGNKVLHRQNEVNSQAVAGKTAQATWRQAFFWLLMGFIPCSAMLAVTTHVSTDIASFPLLWIIPLSLYLVSFILVFAKNTRWRDVNWENYMYPAVLLAMIMYHVRLVDNIWYTIPLHFLAMFLICMCFHARLATDRPAAELLNSYYVWMSVGGIFGGIFNSIFAPMFFVDQVEYLLTLFAALLLVSFMAKEFSDPALSSLRKGVIFFVFLLAFAVMAGLDMGQFTKHGGLFWTLLGLLFLDIFFRFRKIVWLPLLALLIAGFLVQLKDVSVVFKARSFFGVLKVFRTTNEGRESDPDLKLEGQRDVFYRLQHGSTLHGIERRINSMRMAFPLAYYSRQSPIGAVMRAGLIGRAFRQIGVIGLGVGTLAWYGRPWQHFDFFEIDPKVVEIAENPKLFSYLSNCKAARQNYVGDARIALQDIPDQKYDLLVIDAYSSDAIPIHLMTVEAFRLYQSKTRPNGVMLFHITNRYFDLSPIIRRICNELGLVCMRSTDNPKRYSMSYDWYDLEQIFSSEWVAVAANPKAFEVLKRYHRWGQIPLSSAYSLWTDDYANLFHAFRLRKPEK